MLNYNSKQLCYGLITDMIFMRWILFLIPCSNFLWFYQTDKSNSPFISFLLKQQREQYFDPCLFWNTMPAIFIFGFQNDIKNQIIYTRLKLIIIRVKKQEIIKSSFSFRIIRPDLVFSNIPDQFLQHFNIVFPDGLWAVDVKVAYDSHRHSQQQALAMGESDWVFPAKGHLIKCLQGFVDTIQCYFRLSADRLKYQCYPSNEGSRSCVKMMKFIVFGQKAHYPPYNQGIASCEEH